QKNLSALRYKRAIQGNLSIFGPERAGNYIVWYVCQKIFRLQKSHAANLQISGNSHISSKFSQFPLPAAPSTKHG
ncbi:MAG: hypothetical protein P8J87_03760, partial [Verrucomicrobiales bacterium]|nr:hypothetical protein [Verrucomicrobiales bacterium]